MRIGSIELKNNVLLAPMAGVTDLPFRRLCVRFGAGLTYTEMVSAKGMFYENKKTGAMLEICESERPAAVQLFGSEPEILAQMAHKIEQNDGGGDICIIDINMGCPAPKIVKNGEGSALMKNPKLIGEIVKAVSKATTKNVTIKIRKGFNADSVNAVQIAQIAEENGAKAVTVHGRTREQFYSGIVDLEIIAAVKRAVKIPVIGNGDIVSGESAKKMFDLTGCDGIMIGRGTQGNPWIFQQIIHYLQTGLNIAEPCAEEKIKMALSHAESIIAYKGEYTGVREARKHLSWYIKGINGAADARTKINLAEDYLSIKKILSELLNAQNQ